MRLQQRQEKVQEKLATVSNTEKPPVDVFKSIFSDSESDEDDDKSDAESEKSNDENETLTISKVPNPQSIEQAQNSEPKKLAWNRFSAPPSGKPQKIELPDEDVKMETDDFDPPKFSFTAKKDRITTKKSTNTEVKMENRDSDSGMSRQESIFLSRWSNRISNFFDVIYLFINCFLPVCFFLYVFPRVQLNTGLSICFKY